MDKSEIAASLREEIGQLEVSVKKVQSRVEQLKQFVLDLEDELPGPARQTPQPESKFRKAIDSVFGEKPRRPRH
jgi:hypothetical protein